MEWCTIESDPGVFTELIEAMGVKTPVEVSEVVDMDQLGESDGCRGLILLFRYDKGAMAPTDSSATVGTADPSVFFCKQTTNNACGTIAMLHVLLNAEGVDVGEKLSGFKSFVSELPEPGFVGDALASSDDIRSVHNSFGRAEPFVSASRDEDSSGGEAFHFVAYVPKNGALYELDGLQEGPIRLCGVTEPAPGASGSAAEASSSSAGGAGGGPVWLAAARRAVQERISRYSSTGELRFTLLSVRDSRLAEARRTLTRASMRLMVTGQVLEQGGGATARAGALEAVSPRVVGEGWAPAATKGALEAELEELNELVAARQEDFKALQAERKVWREENDRRRHNWVPFSVALLEECARAGRLAGMVEKGNERHRQLRRQAAERQAAAAAASGGAAAPSSTA